MKTSWITRNKIPQVKLGSKFDGITISEENRATVYERRGDDVKELNDFMVANYLNKGIDAVLVGVRTESTDPVVFPGEKSKVQLSKDFYYAVFVQDGFIINEQEHHHA